MGMGMGTMLRLLRIEGLDWGGGVKWVEWLRWLEGFRTAQTTTQTKIKTKQNKTCTRTTKEGVVVRECGVNVLVGHARVVSKGVWVGGYLIRRAWINAFLRFGGSLWVSMIQG